MNESDSELEDEDAEEEEEEDSEDMDEEEVNINNRREGTYELEEEVIKNEGSCMFYFRSCNIGHWEILQGFVPLFLLVWEGVSVLDMHVERNN